MISKLSNYIPPVWCLLGITLCAILALHFKAAYKKPAPPPETAISNDAGYYPPLVIDDTLTIPVPASPPATKSRTQNIDDLFNAGRNPLDTQTSIDSLKTRYEDILVTYLFLKKCGKTTPQDYALIINALTKEIAALKAPARLQYDIFTATRGSYQEVYNKNTCDEANVQKISAQYEQYIARLSGAH